MKIAIALCLFLCISCSQKREIHAPVSSNESRTIINQSIDRAKKLNELERKQISDWITHQKELFYSMPLNYWVNIKDLNKRGVLSKNDTISYQYFVYDFAGNQFYNLPKGFRDVNFNRFPPEIEAVEDALRYLNINEEATLLVPSALAFGTFGDGDKIEYDIPLIIKLKRLE